MAIQFRRGLFANLDKSKLVAGEPVVALDNDKDYVGIAKGANDVIELATKEALDNKVIANPSGTATDSLTKLAIDGDIYSIEGSGGGTVDADLSTSSTNAVQNQTITNALFNLIIGGLISNHEIQVLGLTATKSFSQNDIFLAYASNVDHTIYPVVATTNIAVGDYLTSTSGANRNVYIIDGLYPYINSSLDSMAQYVANMVKANPSGTATSSLTKLQVGNDIYSIDGGGGTVDSTMSETSTNALQNKTIFKQLAYYTYGGSTYIETNFTSQHAYSAGDRFYFEYSGLVRPAQALTNIAVGDTLLIDQNYKQFGALVDSLTLGDLTNVDTSAISGFGDYLLRYDGVYRTWNTMKSPFKENYYAWQLFPNSADQVHKLDLTGVCGNHAVYISNVCSYISYRPSHEGGGTPDYGFIPFAPHIDFSNYISDTSNILHDLTIDFHILFDSATSTPYLVITKNKAINLDYYSVGGVVGLAWNT